MWSPFFGFYLLTLFRIAASVFILLLSLLGFGVNVDSVAVFYFRNAPVKLLFSSSSVRKIVPVRRETFRINLILAQLLYDFSCVCLDKASSRHTQEFIQAIQTFQSVSVKCLWHLFFFFWWNWGLDSGLCTCRVGTLLLDPHLQSVLLWLLEMESQELFAGGWPQISILLISAS
jgi:hypothetical protein